MGRTSDDKQGDYVGLDKNDTDNDPPGEGEVIKESTCCGRCATSLERVFRPCMTEHNTLPDNPTCCQRFKYSLLCPPHGVLSRWITLCLIAFLIWGVLWSITGPDALPGGNLFGLYILIICCFVGGAIVAKIHLPPLLGECSRWANNIKTAIIDPCIRRLGNFASK